MKITIETDEPVEIVTSLPPLVNTLPPQLDLNKPIHGKGWLPDLPDSRDLYYREHARYEGLKVAPSPPSVDLRTTPFMPPVYDQGQIGSCTANAAASAFEYITKKEGIHDFTPSRLYIYYFERALHNWQNSDSGAFVRDAFKVMSDPLIGVCDERVWGYNLPFTQRPNLRAISDATQRPHRKVLKYYRLDRDINLFKEALVNGDPIIMGFSVYASFESDVVAKNGMMFIPAYNEQLIGGHCVKIVGYEQIVTPSNPESLYFIVKNSWGTSWGDKGYFYMPSEIITNPNLSDDFWVLQLV